MYIAASAVRALDNLFYGALDRFLRESGFDDFAEEACREFYAERMGRPGLPPGVLPDADGGVPGGDPVSPTFLNSAFASDDQQPSGRSVTRTVSVTVVDSTAQQAPASGNHASESGDGRATANTDLRLVRLLVP